jgi:hypothetical protein
MMVGHRATATSRKGPIMESTTPARAVAAESPASCERRFRAMGSDAQLVVVGGGEDLLDDD